MKLYYADIVFLAGLLIIGLTIRQVTRPPNGTLEFRSQELFSVTEMYPDMRRKDSYGRILYALYTLPFFFWFVLTMFAFNLEVWRMTDHMLMFTVIGLFIGLVKKLQTLYIGRYLWYDIITYLGIGGYYLILGMRQGVIHELGLLEFFGVSQDIDRVVQPEVYLVMALSLTFIFLLTISILAHRFVRNPSFRS